MFFVISQDLQIFPGLCPSYLFDVKPQPPLDVEPLSATAQDGQVVPIWRMKAARDQPRAVALVFHGNAENLGNFVEVQRWLRSQGITSYAVEYRGFNGRSSGWPSEQGFYLDAQAAMGIVKDTENVDRSQILILGSSIGTGTATYIAQREKVGTLVLLAPYVSITELVSEMPILGYLTPFLKYHFPTASYLEQLENTCVVAAHGKADATIPFHHTERLKERYRGDSEFIIISSEAAGHNNLLTILQHQVAAAIGDCLTQSGP